MIDCSYSVEIMEFEGKTERSFSGLGSGKVGHGWGKDEQVAWGLGNLDSWSFPEESPLTGETVDFPP